jgi:hypothetical protein
MTTSFSLLKRWVSGKKDCESRTGEQPEAKMSRSGDNAVSRTGPWGPVPHFYSETLAYISGDLGVLDKLPAAQVRAQRRARRTKTRAVVLDKKHHSPSQSMTFIQLRDQTIKAYEQRLDIESTEYWQQMARSTQRPIPLSAATEASRSRNADDKTYKGPSQVISNTAHVRAIGPVYDGLRSSPPRCLTKGHSFKPYTGPFFDITSSHGDDHLHDDKHTISPPTSPTNPEPPFSTLRLEQATIAIRAVPKLIITTHRPPRKPTLRSPPPKPKPYPRYTSPQATHLLHHLSTYLPLVPTTDPSTPPPAEILAGLLTKWPTLRRTLHKRNPRLAAQLNSLDWRGVEAGLPEGSFKRRLAEGWVCGGGGMGLFGEWEWPWEGED